MSTLTDTLLPCTKIFGSNRFAGSGRSDDQGMADVADMQREAERRRSFGLGEKQRRRVEMFIAFRAGPDRRQRDHMRQVQGADRRLPDIGVDMAGQAAQDRKSVV